MGQYQISDPQSGKTVTVEGDSAPTQDDAEQIFQQAGLRGGGQQQPSPEDKVTGVPKFLLNLSQGAADVARNVGLGAIPDFLANSNFQTVQKETGINPLMRSSEIKQRTTNLPVVGQVPNLGTAAQDVAGLASWAVPISKGGALVRAGTGALSGALQGASQPNSSVGSTVASGVTGGVLNSVLPGIGNKLAQSTGRLAFGKGGEKFVDLVKEAGPITGNAKTLPDNMFAATAPIRERFQTLVGDASKSIPRTEIFGKSAPSGQPAVEGLIDTIANKSGFASQDAINAYKTKLEQGFNDIYTKYLNDNVMDLIPAYARKRATPDKISKAILNIVQDAESPVPVPVVQQFLEKVGADIQPSSWIAKLLGKNVAPESDFATTLYSSLRSKIAQATGNPDLYNKLQGLKQSGAVIGKSLNARAAGEGKMNIVKDLASKGIPIEAAISLLSGGGLGGTAALGAIGTGLATNPAIVSRGISGGVKFGNAIKGAVTKLGTAGVGALTR